MSRSPPKPEQECARKRSHAASHHARPLELHIPLVQSLGYSRTHLDDCAAGQHVDLVLLDHFFLVKFFHDSYPS